MASVTLEHVGKSYPGGVQAVRDLSLHVEEGELVVLVGPSGSGKTTTLRLIAGLEAPTTGGIRIGDRVVDGLPARARNVAMVFQRHSLYPHLDVRANLAFGLRLADGSSVARFFSRLFSQACREEACRLERHIDDRVNEVARMLDIESLLGRKPAQLSGGEQQRVALGRALVRQPAVFLLDEPLGHLDPPMRTELRRQLHLLHKRISATMIYVTHDQMEAMALGQRIVVLNWGEVQQTDRPETVYDRPCNRFVAGFIGWPPMNFLEGWLIREDGGADFVQWKSRKLPLPNTFEFQSGREVAIGIRPEHVGCGPATPGQVSCPGLVSVIEPLGARSLVTFEIDGDRIAGLVDRSAGLRNGQTVEVRFDMRYLHMFDRGTGASLALSAG